MRRSASKGGQAVRRLGGWTLLAASLTVYPPSRLSAQQVNNSGALFLVFPVGARAVGMGQTAAALDGRGEAAFWNPAGLATLEKNEFGLQTATLVVAVGGQLATGPEGALRLGVAVRNIGFKLQVNNRDQADALPARLIIGALYRIVLPAGRGVGPGERFDLKVAADVDSPWGSYGESQMRVGLDVGYQRLLRVRGGYAFVHDGLSGPSVGVGVETGAIGVDLARSFLSGSDLVVTNPTFFSFRVVF